MEQNPLEQQNKINVLREETKKDLVNTFENKEEKFIARLDSLVKQLGSFEQNGMVFNKEETTRLLKEAVNIEDKETFVNHMMKTLEPIIRFKATQPRNFDKSVRESGEANAGDFKLSEFLYYCVEDDATISIHLQAGRDFMARDKMEDFQKDINDGFSKLAEIVKKDKDIEKITATSWIVALRGSAKRLEKMGFTIVGPISEEEREKHFDNEKRPIAEAFIGREDFLARYGKKEN